MMTSKNVEQALRVAEPAGPRQAAPIPEDQFGYLIAVAARAPSVHNTQPWRFRLSQGSIEMFADTRRRLQVDPEGRELLISCGAALFGLRLAVRSLGYQPVVDLGPALPRRRLLARVSLGAATPITEGERQMLKALPHRHTHRGPFEAASLPAGLLAALQHDARAEGATLALIDPAGSSYLQLADIVSTAARRRDLDPWARAEVRRWRRPADSVAYDGVPAQAFAAGTFPDWADGHRGRLRQRDFDLGHGMGLLPADGPPAAATAILVTRGDDQSDWMRAGQALQRLLAHAAERWVFASIYTQPLEDPATRALIRGRLGLPGVPHLVLQFGKAKTTEVTARHPPSELIEPPKRDRSHSSGERGPVF
jgi:nitroreductase